RVEDLGDEIVILDADGDAVHRVDGDATAAVHLLQEGVARRDIPAELTDAVASLADKGLVDGPRHLSRRAALATGGGVALAAATVTTFALADPAAASTMCTNGITGTDAGTTFTASNSSFMFKVGPTGTAGPGTVNVQFRAWGGGGGGGGAQWWSGAEGGGGGGGAYAGTSYALTECTEYTFNVTVGGIGSAGANADGGMGGTSSVLNGPTTIVSAIGGSGGTRGKPGPTNGAGGAGGSTGTGTIFAGGTGGTRTPTYATGGGGGGGGGSAGVGTSPGNSGTGGAGGAGTPGGGKGGDGGTSNNNGNAGTAPGGGGGGAGGPSKAVDYSGGTGARGEVWIGH
ncbi:MAG: hypothetical protein KDA98_13470, partial [Acidimicrobiales bacterium]|nr:hypothetical protein [Acidimicrobiales bacterium]